MFKCLVQEKNRYKASDCFFEKTSKATSNFCFRLSLFLLVNFLQSIVHSLSENFSGSQAAYGTTFRDTAGYQKAVISSVAL
jgi:hypothetical protein